jgi:esterase/lipase superfamily enzyme
LLLLSVVITACAGSGRYTINLMPAPAVFAEGDINPLPKGPPPLSYDDFGMLYATDRKPADDLDKRPFYLNENGFLVRLGRARVKAGGGIDWEAARRISLSTDRTRDYPLEVVSVEETGVLGRTYTFLSRPSQAPKASDELGQEFAKIVNQRLAASGVKDIYVYVHGFRVVFDVPVLVASELWHFLGYRGAFIAYAWPSTPRALAYMSDVETASAMARKLRLFLTFLAEETQVENIHIVGFSAGSRLVVRALKQLALLNADATDEEIRQDVRIGSVIIVGGDISREEFGVALTDGMLRIPERTVVYVSSADRALQWSRRIFRRERLGEMWAEEPSPPTVEFLRTNPSLEFINVTEAAGATSGNGHSYFRQSPWVSSDLLTVLAFDMDPARRGLEKDGDMLVWTFPPDYIERLRKALLERNPDLQ